MSRRSFPSRAAIRALTRSSPGERGLDLDELLQQCHDSVGCQLRLGVLLRGRGGDEQPGEASTEGGAVGLGYSEQLADDGERQRERETGDEVDPAVGSLRGDAVEQLVDDGLDPWPQRLDAPRREGARDQPAEPGVIRRIDGEHVPGEGGSGKPLGHDARIRCQGGVHVLRQPLIVERGASLVVADHEPGIVAVDKRHRVNRAAPADVGEHGKRVVAVVSSPRLQRRVHVVLDHACTCSHVGMVRRILAACGEMAVRFGDGRRASLGLPYAGDPRRRAT